MIRKRYPKEAVVLRLRMPTKGLVRRDHSIDLLQARKKVGEKLTELFGEFRDYNGGMLATQMKAFEGLCESLGNISDEKRFLLENYFHAIPSDKINLSPTRDLKELFLLLTEALGAASDKEDEVAVFSKERFHIYISDQKEKLLPFEKNAALYFYLHQGGLHTLGKIEQ